jgi:PAS domain-containing protein
MRIAEDGKVTFVDQRAVQLLGTPVEEMLGGFWWQLAVQGEEAVLRNAFEQMLVGDQPLKVGSRLPLVVFGSNCSVKQL